MKIKTKVAEKPVKAMEDVQPAQLKSAPSRQAVAGKPGRVLNPINLAPYDQRAELSVLGAMMIDSQAVRTARHFLTPKHFFVKANAIVFDTICALVDRGSPADLTLVSAELNRTGMMDRVGSMEMLLSAIDSVATAAHVGYYARVVAGFSLDREIIKIATYIAKDREIESRSELMDKLRALNLERSSLDAPPMVNYQQDLNAILEDLMDTSKSRVFYTHFPEIDIIWKGMKEGDLNVWAAATNKGKSVLAINMLHRWGVNDSEPALYIGTEMRAAQTLQRHLSIASGIDAWKLRKPELNEQERSKLREIVKDRLSHMNLYILDDPEPSLAKIEAAIHATKAKRVMVDYLGRCELPPGEALRLQIREFMKKLKTIAVRHNCIIDLLAQLNRSNYSDLEKAPVLADLLESSSIEQEADRVALFWSPKKKQLQKETEKDLWRVIEVIFRKDRSGPVDVECDLYMSNKNLLVMEKREYADPFNHKIGSEDAV